MGGEKLTKPQLEFLREIASGAIAVDASYKPAQVLLRRGFAVFLIGKHSDLLQITPAGRNALARHAKAEGS